MSFIRMEVAATKTYILKKRYGHCVKSVHIWSYSGPHSVRMKENTDQNNSEYGRFLRSKFIRKNKCMLEHWLKMD